MPIPVLHKELHSLLSGPKFFLRKFCYLFELMKTLEPHRLRGIVRLSEHANLSGIDWYSYTHSIFRWRKRILRWAPDLETDLTGYEALYVYGRHYIFKTCDEAHKQPDKAIAILILVLVFEEIQCMIEDQTLNHSLAEHMQLVLKSRLRVLCGQAFNSHRRLDTKSQVAAVCVASNNQLELYLRDLLPYHHRISSFELLRVYIILFPTHLTTSHLDSNPPCLLNRFNSNAISQNAIKTDDCCCGWILDSISSGVLGFFGLSTKSFARHFHTRQQVFQGVGAERTSFSKLMKLTFGQRMEKNISLKLKSRIFWEAFCKSMNIFLSTDFKETIVPTPEDLQELFFHILSETAMLHNTFWDYVRENAASIGTISDTYKITYLFLAIFTTKYENFMSNTEFTRQYSPIFEKGD